MFEHHVKSVVQSFFLHQIFKKIQSFLSVKNTETVIHAFITTLLDYCNLLFASESIQPTPTQLMQHAAARLLTRANKRMHINPILPYHAYLHWLVAHFRKDLMIVMIIFQAHIGLTVPTSLTC